MTKGSDVVCGLDYNEVLKCGLDLPEMHTTPHFLQSSSPFFYYLQVHKFAGCESQTFVSPDTWFYP